VLFTPVAVVLAALVGSALTASADPPSRDVRVINSAAEPVPVTGVIVAAPAAARQPFQQDVSILVPSGTLSASTTFSVPVGKRLVIELVSGSTRVDAAELLRVNLSTTVGGTTVSHTVPPVVYRREFSSPITPD